MGMLLSATEATNVILDSGVLSFIVDGAKQVLGVMTTPPLGTFISIGIVGGIVGLVATIVHVVRS